MLYQQRQVARSVFRAYDIRGIVDEELDVNAYYSIGLGLALYLKKLDRQHIFIARDGRISSKNYTIALKSGLLESGIHVVDLGEAATPVMYFATHLDTFNIDCGLMVTGSHNPANYNGIKMVLAGKTLVHSDIDQLFEYVEKQKRIHGHGTDTYVDIIPPYKKRLTQDIQIKRPLKIVVDCGNGIAGPVVPDVLHALGCEIISLYCDVDGTFPNHHPDPTVESNLVDLKKAVFEHQADLGLAFDGDADRLGLVTNLGEMIFPDRLMMLYVQELLDRIPGATIVYDVKCSSHLARMIEVCGGIGIMCPTGHSIVKKIMKQEHAALAGEMSGHLFFKDRWYGFDDALYSACRLIEIISRSPLSVSEQFNRIPNSVNTPELKIPIADKDKFVFMQRFVAQAQFFQAKLVTIDGIRVEFEKGWGLLRASNTTPCLVARFEAEDEVQLNIIKELFKEQIHRVDSELMLPF